MTFTTTRQFNLIGEVNKDFFEELMRKVNQIGEGISGRKKNVFKAVQSTHKGPVVRKKYSM